MQRVRVKLFDLLGVEANVLLGKLLLELGSSVIAVVVNVVARMILGGCV